MLSKEKSVVYFQLSIWLIMGKLLTSFIRHRQGFCVGKGANKMFTLLRS